MSKASGKPGGRKVEPGAHVVFEGRTWQVAALVGATVRLVDQEGTTASVLPAYLFADPGFEVAGVQAPASAPQWGLFETVPVKERERALAWQRHIREVETGLPAGPGSGGVPRPQYDPEQRTLAEREQAKAEEMTALGWAKVSRPTVHRMRSRYRAQGLWGLVDGRTQRSSSPTGRTDERVVAAVLEALRRQRGRSRGTLRGLRELTGQILHDTYGAKVKLPPVSTFNRLVNALADPLERPGSPARTATTAARPFTPTVALRPGEMVQVDTTRLDVMAVLDDGSLGRPEMTIALDVASRSILAAVLRPEGTKSVDAALLLAEMAVPHPARDGWPKALSMAHAAVPYERLLSLDERLAGAAARPVVVPETIVVDRGHVFVSEAFVAACETLGVSVQPAPPRQPTAKGAVERTFGAINTLLCQHIAGYTGSNVTRRGPGVAGEACWTVAQLQDLLDEWITAWQNRPHEGLRHPVLPKTALTPNEMWGALLAVSGYVPLPLSGRDYLELLPVRWQAITDRGIRINYRTYDAPVLNEHRGRPSATASRGGKWEVHHNPHDARQVWLRLPDGELTELPWIHRDHVHRPFNERTWRHIQATVEQRADREQHEADLADALDQLLRRARPAPAANTGAAAAGNTASRVRAPAAPPATVPSTKAAGAEGRAPMTEGGLQAPGAHEAVSAQAEWGAGDSLDDLEHAVGPTDGIEDRDSAPYSELTPDQGTFVLYDAYQEAEQW
ncbi:Mu transposase C-terminal domain-containing protein [Actinacidiphila oryziradicis]|uniref:Transposase n=1 Tax=Actinacidiphila oryziradicis TaxID=2571141 RepID=A0A4U0RTF6_9ACTN|nr:Mu transposase C-terminal domain-containing protein [Actinacidiphila oryziradicis]TJZ99431.1 transposase [Actinacidiphila oryziradicis]